MFDSVTRGLAWFGVILVVAAVLTSRLQAALTASDVLPRLVVIWLCMDGVIRIYDGLFGVLRPASFEWTIYAPFKLYTDVDHTYRDLDNAFMWTESYMDLYELSIGSFALYLSSRSPQKARVLALIATTMTFHKTCMYLLMEPMGDYASTKHNDSLSFWMIWFFPNFVYVVMPGLCMKKLFDVLADGPAKESKPSPTPRPSQDSLTGTPTPKRRTSLSQRDEAWKAALKANEASTDDKLKELENDERLKEL